MELCNFLNSENFQFLQVFNTENREGNVKEKSAEAGLNRRPLNLQSNALPLSYRRTC